MRCTFCSSPAAHPATGCQYGPRTLACRACVETFWVWMRSHTNKRARRGHGPATALTFYEAATVFSRWASSGRPEPVAQSRQPSDPSRETDR
ncbi:MAG: hypothetical protein KF764_03880 [Labilithrix sp.]|nr:hypothetical protein [Labilithrix sp.]MBX3222199.1 hypothetical protein [Labilithrix sp.]